MKLFLSSYGFGEHAAEFCRLAGNEKKLLFIDNAKDCLMEDERALHVAEKLAELELLGFEPYELDLRNYFDKPNELWPIIEQAKVMWVSGGNTFVLRRALRYSGLDDMLRQRLKEGDFLYGGSSAGSIIMTKTLKGTERGDDPYEVPEGYKEEIIWDGLNMVYPQLVPHYKSSWFGDEAQAMVDYFTTEGLMFETLRDGEAYIVDGGSEKKW
ncbi:hypothetical protein FJZ39_03475 [Candidatus Saccharibacteria bacterium]|nr:hypothetical protein [Candidatus Saccharibacteria bacterium]